MSQGEENKGALSGISEEDLARLKAQMLLEMRQKKPEASAETLKPEEPSTPQGEPVGAPSMAHKPEVTPKGKKPKKPKSLARKIIEWVGVVVVGALFIVVLAGQIDSMVHSNEHYGQPLRFGWGSFVVRTSSMEPEYPVDSAIITHNDDADDIYNRFLNLKEDEHIDITFMDAYDIYGDPYGEFAAPKSEDEKTTFVQRTGLTRVPMTHRLRAIHVNEEVASGEGRYYFFVSGINNKGEKSLEGQYQVFNEKYILGVVKFNSPFLGGFFSFISSASFICIRKASAMAVRRISINLSIVLLFIMITSVIAGTSGDAARLIVLSGTCI